ncbi:hypothetical protein E2C01_025197 [Portunus trituberculatus]|uniref:Uncharacterized protein n=1 Tax=Portunus trituberculatus TaxID=210409 RepID=A0A5B7EFC2_PORTR|nr:hypothetical protein [Portunus trituberculatus]
MKASTTPTLFSGRDSSGNRATILVQGRQTQDILTHFTIFLQSHPLHYSLASPPTSCRCCLLLALCLSQQLLFMGQHAVKQDPGCQGLQGQHLNTLRFLQLHHQHLDEGVHKLQQLFTAQTLH